MRLNPWATICLAGAIASSIPLATSHEIHLPYLPSLGGDNEVNSYLSLKWAVINGSLFANGDRVFPPSMSMQLHAPQREGAAKNLVTGDEIDLSYAIEARPLSTEENGSTSTIVRVRVDLFDHKGDAVTTDTVLVDLLSRPDGSSCITRIRMEPIKKHGESNFHRNRPWRMKLWPTQVGAIFHGKDKQDSSSNQPQQTDNQASPSRPQPTDAAASSTSKSQYGFIFSPYWSPTTYSRRPQHNPHDGHRNRTFMRLIRPVILPAVLGAVAGLVACLVGFVIGHLFMSLSARLGLRKRRHHRTRTISIEEEFDSEKAQLLPQIYVTEVDSMDA
ncbi:uncharacterized protein N7498_009167 [Penicillium cinerascens]|uniref:Uncharacterized protein n=1 Tax=Penicillium cinerascens TaxID=70096 RepID=A0A9W9J5T3_9EURO|nr:uncharacterized protein N7498_009167 [Penicillium cinerascens]KAJ5190182.1 hypothetical protein N7498_009167 [Penicillium cinerascens]